MNLLDLAVVAVATSAIVAGYRLGLLRGAVAWLFVPGYELTDRVAGAVAAAVAVVLDRGDSAYALSTAELRSVPDAGGTDEVDTGDCLQWPVTADVVIT